MANLQYFSSLILPIIILIFGLILLLSKKDIQKAFYSGAKEGIRSSFDLMPNLCLLIVGTSMLSNSGAIDIISKILDPVFEFLKIPSEILPLIITRPLSSGASIAAYEDIVSRFGVDSFAALCGAVTMASSDTVIYVISMYFSSTSVQKTKYTVPCAVFIPCGHLYQRNWGCSARQYGS